MRPLKAADLREDTSLQMSQLSQVSVSFPNNDEVQESISSIW